jgi:hypothetical protein
MSIAGIMEARPPYVTFELRAEEDRAASMESGKFIARDIPFALITPQGSKDRIERNAEEWLAHITSESRNGRFPTEWVTHYRTAFEAWKNGQEIPVDGTPILTWPPLSPANVRMLLDLNIRTVEELAQATEEAIMHLGMGARALKQRAIDFLSQANNAGKASAEMEVLRVGHAETLKQNEELKKQLAELTAKVAAMAGATAATAATAAKPAPKS